MLNSHRHTRMPASAISAATTAVAAPPDHSCLASTVRPGELPRSESDSCYRDMAQAAFVSGVPGLTGCMVFPVRRSRCPMTGPALRLLNARAASMPDATNA